jgi:hypothetical protein
MIEYTAIRTNDLLKSMSDKELSEALQLCNKIISPNCTIPKEELQEYPAVVQLLFCVPASQQSITHVVTLLEGEVIHRWFEENP